MLSRIRDGGLELDPSRKFLRVMVWRAVETVEMQGETRRCSCASCIRSKFNPFARHGRFFLTRAAVMAVLRGH